MTLPDEPHVYSVSCDERDWKHRGHGFAIDRIYEDEEGRFWVTNDEYTSQVNFCPWTGKEAKTKLPPPGCTERFSPGHDHERHVL